MAQSINCDTHGEPGIIYLSTLQGTVETITLCIYCMRDFITGWASTLGLIEEWKSELRAELGAELEEPDEGHFTGTKEEWDAAVKQAHERWGGKVSAISPADWQEAVQSRMTRRAVAALDEQMEGM